MPPGDAAVKAVTVLGDGRLLLISCDDPEHGVAGGLFVYDGERLEIVDRMCGTGLATDGERVARCLWSGSGGRAGILVYDAGGVLRYHRLQGVTDPHGIHCAEDAICVVATGENRLVWFGADGRERARWQAPGERDSWHLNGVVEVGGRTLVCAFGRFDRHRGWSGLEAHLAGCLVDVETGADVLNGLTMPHDPVLLNGEWLVCNSGVGELVSIDGLRNHVLRRQYVGTWLRGLAIDDDRIYLGTSPERRGEGRTACASVQVLDRATWGVVERLELPAREIFDLLSIPAELAEGVRRGAADPVTHVLRE